MQTTLRAIGNSVGITIPASELKSLSAQIGDTIEINITKVIKAPRSSWDDANLWQNSDLEPLHLNDLTDNDFDGKEWQW
ncbi:AbrB/MazE/SpoVT family DNA-binding domain-containing protein [Cysteiniphilum halobium]|uniref:AbrB/MazE/SpoVT family DNA-binding domain-containing protein n=1 Tax=Cysteiniphilum halobium TaxID=2219059 RepID=UPI000E65BAFB|nr:antitoxin ChpS [Cysteiniphilum halobium]